MPREWRSLKRAVRARGPCTGREVGLGAWHNGGIFLKSSLRITSMVKGGTDRSDRWVRVSMPCWHASSNRDLRVALSSSDVQQNRLVKHCGSESSNSLEFTHMANGSYYKSLASEHLKRHPVHVWEGRPMTMTGGGRAGTL